MNNLPSPINARRWLDLRARQGGSWAFLLNRLSSLGLTFFLGLHLVVLNKLAQGAQVYDNFVKFAQMPLMKVSEVILIAAVLFHGLNGLRITILTFGIGIRYQKQLFMLAALLTILLIVVFVARLFEV